MLITLAVLKVVDETLDKGLKKDQLKNHNFTNPITLQRMYIFCARPGFEGQIVSYVSKHASQSLSDRPFYVYSVLRRITWKLHVVFVNNGFQKGSLTQR